MTKQAEQHSEMDLMLDNEIRKVMQRDFLLPEGAEAAKQEAFAKIRGKQRQRKWILLRRGVTGLATMAAAFTVVFLYNPTVASKIPFLGQVFAKLGTTWDFGGDYSDYAKSLGTDPENTEAFYSKTVDGTTLTFSEIYANNVALYLSMIITTEEPFPEHVKQEENRQAFLDLADYTIRFDFAEEYEIPVEGVWVDGSFVDDYTYVGVMRQDWSRLNQFYDVKMQQGIELEIPENFQMQLSVNRIEGWKAESAEHDNYQKYWLEGPWEFEIDVTIDYAKTLFLELNDVNEAGYGILTMTKTPFEILVEEQRPQEAVTYIAAFDAEGRLLSNEGTGRLNAWSVTGKEVSKVRFYILEWNRYMELKKDWETENFEEIIAKEALYMTEVITK